MGRCRVADPGVMDQIAVIVIFTLIELTFGSGGANAPVAV